MDLSIQENIFEIVYKEYKDYEKFVKGQLNTIKKDREGFEKFAIENKDNIEAITEKMFEVNQNPVYYQTDLLRLQVKLIYTHNALKDLIDIPEDVTKEISEFVIPKQMFTIKDGKAEVVDVNYNEQIKKEAKKNYEESVKAFLSYNKK